MQPRRTSRNSGEPVDLQVLADTRVLRTIVAPEMPEKFANLERASHAVMAVVEFLVAGFEVGVMIKDESDLASLTEKLRTRLID